MELCIVRADFSLLLHLLFTDTDKSVLRELADSVWNLKLLEGCVTKDCKSNHHLSDLVESGFILQNLLYLKPNV